jgi:hypothetical protein
MRQVQLREVYVFILLPLLTFIAGFFGGTIDQQVRTTVADLLFNVFNLLLP